MMITKATMVQELGEDELILPTLVNNALAANDRIKYYFTLLQTARSHAAHPEAGYSNLRAEREVAGVEDPSLDRVVAGSETVGRGLCRIPDGARILSGIRASLVEMIAPFIACGDGRGGSFEGRLRELSDDIPSGEGDIVPDDAIGRLTAADTGTSDSIHQLVMDLHRALNDLQGDLAGEILDGAMTYLLEPGDRGPVSAFMAGIRRTAPLKFDHPGLGTTATRNGPRLVIQNDIGMTDAHVLVVNVEGLTVSVIYTDIHMPRLQFFQGLFEARGIEWEDTLSKKSGGLFEEKVYHLSVGRYRAGGRADLEDFLAFLGSRLVFLIDWNRARKRLRTFLQNRDATAVLRWAADNDHGHMAFLMLGGEKIIYEALELASGVPLRYGEPLHQILGREKTIEYFEWVLKRSSTGLRAGHSRLLILDEIKTELLRYFRTAQENLMEICEEHATLSIDVATVLRDSLLSIERGGDMASIARNAKRAKQWESEADALVNKVRSLSRRIESAGFYAELITIADDTLDALEEAMFLSTLIPKVTSSKKLTAEVAGLAEIAVKSSQEFLKALMASQYIHRGYTRDEMQDFLQAVDRVIGYERECDDALRLSEKTILTESTDYREMMIFFETARMIEGSTNSLMKSVYVIRDSILEGVNR